MEDGTTGGNCSKGGPKHPTMGKLFIIKNQHTEIMLMTEWCALKTCWENYWKIIWRRAGKPGAPYRPYVVLRIETIKWIIFENTGAVIQHVTLGDSISLLKIIHLDRHVHGHQCVSHNACTQGQFNDELNPVPGPISTFLMYWHPPAL